MTQTALVLILKFGLYNPDEKVALENKLEQLIHENDNMMATGFVGTPFLLHVLTGVGKTDLAYQLLFEERSPSWLYSVNQGATTMWEHWNSIKEDGSFWNTDMNSFNHYAYGAVFDWIFGVVVGIKPTAESPACEKIILAPHPDKRLGFIDSSIEKRYGKIRSAWYYKGNAVYYEFEIPEGVTAQMLLPSGYTKKLTKGCYHFSE